MENLNKHGDMVQVTIERTTNGNHQKRETLRVFYMSREQERSERWRWFIGYVCAVYKVKFPKESVSAGMHFFTICDGSKKEIDYKLRSKKANLTKWKNRLENYKNNYIPSLLCPDVENDATYLKALDKIRRLEIEIENG